MFSINSLSLCADETRLQLFFIRPRIFHVIATVVPPANTGISVALKIILTHLHTLTNRQILLSLKEDASYGQVSMITGTVLQIDVNGALFWMFFHRVDPSQISHVRVIGDISLYRLTYHVGMQVSGFMLLQ